MGEESGRGARFGRLARASLVGAVGVLVALAACGGGGDGSSAGGREVVVPGLSQIARALVGRTEVLMVDMETREVVVVRAGDGDGDGGPALSVHEVPALPGDGPIVEVSGVQGDDGTWVVAGTECHSIDVYGPGECDPGVPTVAVWADGEWALVEAPPSLTGAAALRGIAGGTALVEERRGADGEAFWMLDTGDATLDEVPWAPPPVEPPDDGGPGSYMATRSTCLAGERLVSVEARPSADGGRFDTRVVVVGASERSGEVLVDAPVGLGDGHVPQRVLCGGGSDVGGGAGSAYLVAHDRADGRPVAYEVDLDTGFVAGAVGPSTGGGGLPGGTRYGPGTAVFSYGAAGETTFRSVPGEPGALAADTPPGTAEALLWADGRWSQLGPEAGFDTDDRLLPVAGTVVAWTPSTGRFRLPDG